ncbi:MAG: Rv3654c family TadE-like protein [Nocardioidaceae bacterium]
MSARSASAVSGARGERGSAAVLGIVMVGVLVAVAVMASVLGGAVVDQRRVASAVDLGALSGAAAAQHGQDGCAVAATMMARNGSRLTRCTVAGAVVSVRGVRATRPVLGLRFTVSSRARAGPQDAAP